MKNTKSIIRKNKNHDHNQEQTDGLTTVVFADLTNDEIVEVVGGVKAPPPPGGGGCGTTVTVGCTGCVGCFGCWGRGGSGGCAGAGGGAGGDSCFVAGTLVSMADGSSRPIEEVDIGDQVLSYDDRAREVVPARVTYKFVHADVDDGLIRINGRLEATPYHVIHADGRYMRVDELQIGSTLIALSGTAAARIEPAVVSSLKQFNKKQTVYNLEIEKQHTYFANGILVHNAKKNA